MSAAPLAGQVALVTGAGSGLGRAIAIGLAQAGAHVALAARHADAIESVASDLRRQAFKATAIRCDVRDPQQIVALVAATLDAAGGLDILVNNAGIFKMASVATTDDATWDAILDTNLKGAFLVTRATLPHLVARRGRIFNLVSVAGRTAFRNNGAYCASKWGLMGFTNVLREELRSSGVRVTAVIPGAIDTPLWDAIPGDWNRARMLRPETVARLVVEVCTQPEGTSTDEIVVSPAGGAL